MHHHRAADRVRHLAHIAVERAHRIQVVAAFEQGDIRELIIEVTGRLGFVGTPAEVAADIDRFVQEDASDGFILVPHLTPAGLDDFVDQVVPLLQERGPRARPAAAAAQSPSAFAVQRSPSVSGRGL